MKLYNTMSRQKEEFIPLEEGKVRMYVCGPTVYNYIHIGNARPMIVFDTVRRYFEYKGYDVNYVSNFTDVDDKIIKKANEEGVTAEEISKRYIEECKKDMADMNVLPATTHPLATEEIGGMIELIGTLIEKGYAYAKNGTVYFRTRQFKDYGKLSHKNLDDLRSGNRALLVSGEDEKEDPLDFVLWKPKKEGEPAWESPWSEGRPGWHIECSEMSKKYLGEQIDIHAGGEDLIFPHHENEIAQSRAAYDSPIANYWIHNGMVNIDGEKMSKSLGNVIWAKDMIAKIGGNVLRWVMLSAHYRAPLNINEEAIETAKKELNRVATAMKQAYVKLNLADVAVAEAYDETQLAPFLDAMQDDLNTPNAFAAVFETVKVLNQTLRQRDADLNAVAALLHTLEKMMEVLGIDIPRLTMCEEDKQLHKLWKAAVKEKDFATADQYRAQLIEKGIL